MWLGAAVGRRGLNDPEFLATLDQADYLTADWGIHDDEAWGRLLTLGKPLFGHPLIPQNQAVPLEDRERIHADPDTYIPQVFEARLQRLEWLKDKVFGLTVVNEAWNDQGNLRRCYWSSRLDFDYIERAFQVAHEIAPDLPLYYCDYRVWDDRKWNPILSQLAEYKRRGVPIHGVNLQLQFHLMPPPHLLNVRRRIRQIQDLGLEVMANELTIFINYRAFGTLPQRLLLQAQIYRQTANLTRSLGVTHLVLWCWSDRYQWHWIDSLMSTDAPGIFDRDCQPKLAAKWLMAAWQQSKS